MPSANRWCFQIGTSALRVSISAREARNASSRWALERLREVCDRIATKFDLHEVAAVHRTGALAIGDIAVIVATSSAHRDEAFRASRALIDTLKAEVPIWKHQRFADGTDEWVGTP